jgi:hypothetical protein
MWSETEGLETEGHEPDCPRRDQLLIARLRMEEALRLLDEHSVSAAAASLDLALHQLDRELSAR